MADSEFQRPTLAENISMPRNDLFARRDLIDPLRPHAEAVQAKVYGAAVNTC
ncbi:hypothetical protein HmCmsJML040_04508 [Escherichia coli]|nr:hypothetical protein HmCmsJML040_04508 [Escherichia coli]